MVDCSQAGKLNIPDNIPDAATEIDLSNNFITALRSGDFENCIAVRTLNLQMNKLSGIPRNIFKSMSNIRVLGLNDNWFTYNNNSFPDDPFGNLVNLKTISLQCTAGYTTMYNEFLFMLEMLPLTLEELNINIPGVFGIADQIKKFLNLRKLGLYDTLFDETIVLQNDTFKPLKDIAIQELKIETLHLDSVHPLAFSHFSKLKTLDMSGTKGLTIAELQPALLGMESMDLEELKLSHFIKTEDKPELVVLDTKMFENSHFRKLVEIRMDNTGIYEIKVRKRPFSQLVNLEKLNLSSNFLSLKHIQRISHSSIWKKLTKLRELDLSFQTCISYDATTNLTLDLPSNLSRVYLSHTRSADDGQPVNIIIISSSSKISNFKFHK